MLRMRTSSSLLVGGALVLTLAGCGSDSPDPGTTTSASVSSPTSSVPSTAMATPTSSPSAGAPAPMPSNSGIVPDETWSQVIKKFVPPLTKTGDTEVAVAGRKVCTDFEASPNAATAKTILARATSTLGLDATQAQIFTTAAITHFCTDRSTAWSTAALG